MNTTLQLHEAGQSVWYDNIQRKLIKNGEMARMIAQGEIRGVTSNPSIFMNAITKSTDYDDSLVPLSQRGMTAKDIYYQLAIEDIQAVADLFRPLYEQADGGDGYVSLEVSPYLAHDTLGTVDEAKALWKRVGRPNVMIKIPATKEGLPAITAALAEGININVTLIFALERYAAVMDAHMTGLEKRVAAGLPINRIHSVASFFVSRVDTNIDAQLQKIVNSHEAQAKTATELQGKAAIANACLAYAAFEATLASDRYRKLAASGANAQRPLWASTGTKNAKYSDVMYIEQLVAPQTVNTVPPATLSAFLNHGVVRADSLAVNLKTAAQTMAELSTLGISMQSVTQQLEDEGVKSFSDAFSALLAGVEQRRTAVIGVA
ncbi:MAG TPA: transaldolase [Anaerolineae bacterium]